MPLDHHQTIEAAQHLEKVLASIDAGELTATPTEVARMEGAALALRKITETATG